MSSIFKRVKLYSTLSNINKFKKICNFFGLNILSDNSYDKFNHRFKFLLILLSAYISYRFSIEIIKKHGAIQDAFKLYLKIEKQSIKYNISILESKIIIKDMMEKNNKKFEDTLDDINKLFKEYNINEMKNYQVNELNNNRVKGSKNDQLKELKELNEYRIIANKYWKMIWIFINRYPDQINLIKDLFAAQLTGGEELNLANSFKEYYQIMNKMNYALNDSEGISLCDKEWVVEALKKWKKYEKNRFYYNKKKESEKV